MKKLKGKVSIITGAANGIGLAIAQKFADEGAVVIMGDIDLSAAGQAAHSINKQHANAAIAIECDVTNSSDVSASIALAESQFGRLDILVNNAAVAIGGKITEMPEAEWNRVLNTNLTSAYRTISSALPIMLQQGRGCIINLSSTQAHRSWASWTAYAAAKGGLLAMTTQLAGEFAAQGIRINAISPGAIDTPMNAERMAKEGGDLKQGLIDMHAMKRMGKAEEVAAVAVFLASDDSSFITGQDIVVDGGLCTLPRYHEPRN
ncbi:SDR family NAD(P)-dependent oxidoreductase [Cerasicoccus arenae]|nr:glucose 1-dehydrogenase [Cerasicoccus arenae]MBK1859272.1 glucose 1-dehydrogenase [Cerasicoccus arenae]